MAGQTRFGADAHNNFERIGSLDVAQGKCHATGQNLDHLFIGIVPFFRQQAAFTVVDGCADDIGGFCQRRFGFFAQRAVRHSRNQNGGFNHQRLFGKACAQDGLGFAILPIGVDGHSRQLGGQDQ
jgi:hypothetical protein